MKDLIEYYQTIENGMNDLGLHAVECRGTEDGSWSLEFNHNRIHVDCWKARPNQPLLQFLSVMLNSSSEYNLSLYTKLLELNKELIGASFCVSGNKIMLKQTSLIHDFSVDWFKIEFMNYCKCLHALSESLTDAFPDNKKPGKSPIIS